jgi:hypothetical protein
MELKFDPPNHQLPIGKSNSNSLEVATVIVDKLFTETLKDKDFDRRLTVFLATRLDDLANEDKDVQKSFLNLPRRWPGSKTKTAAMGSTGGGGRGKIPVNSCLFTVTTKTPGLTVYWSGAYYISTANVFGGLSTPTHAPLTSGNYIFGADGLQYGNTVQWNHRVVSLPGTATSHQLKY